jgi:hypothetical protein
LSWLLGANCSPWFKFHPNWKFQEEILSNSKPKKFSEFLFEIHFKSGEVTMYYVVPFLKPLTTIIYFKIFKLGKVLFGSVKV